MNLVIRFRGENGKIVDSDVYTFEEDELTKLRKDFVDYFRKNTSMSAGAYTCKVGDRSTCVILKFDEVIYIGP